MIRLIKIGDTSIYKSRIYNVCGRSIINLGYYIITVLQLDADKSGGVGGGAAQLGDQSDGAGGVS